MRSRDEVIDDYNAELSENLSRAIESGKITEQEAGEIFEREKIDE